MRQLAIGGLCLGLAACTPSAATLVSEEDIVDDAIPMALDGLSGDVVRGATEFADREGGHCLLCHVHHGLDAPFPGELGPDLTHVGDYLSPEQIRLRIVDMSRLAPDTIMPSYYRTRGLYQVEHGLEGRPVLSSQQIEDLVAFLAASRAEG